MSERVFVPPSTRLDRGQEMNSALRSIRNTSIEPLLHVRRYFAAVAPPYPPPMTMTRPTGLEGAAGSIAQPGRSDVAARALEVFRKSRRVSRFMAASYLAFCAEKYAR